MSLIDLLFGQFVDVIDWVDDGGDTLVWRFERHNSEIKYGAKLTVREGQAAVFVDEGRVADVFEPGLYKLKTANLPILSTLQHWDHGFESPFKSDVFFVSTRRFTDLKWGTKNPVTLRDPEFGPVRLRAFGAFEIRVAEPATFLREIVGASNDFTTQEIHGQLRSIIVARLSTALATSRIPVLDLAANLEDLSAFARERIQADIAAYGVEIPRLVVENVSLPPDVEAALDRRASIGVVGDLRRYAQFQAAEAMRMGAANGGGIGADLAGGMVMARQLETLFPPAPSPLGVAPPAPSPAAPPPLDPAVWHVAIDGAARGPVTRATLSAWLDGGEISADSLVWRAGQLEWAPLKTVAPLAALIAPETPPPLPSADAAPRRAGDD